MYLEMGGGWLSLERYSVQGSGANDLPEETICLGGVGRGGRICFRGLEVGRNYDVFTGISEST